MSLAAVIARIADIDRGALAPGASVPTVASASASPDASAPATSGVADTTTPTFASALAGQATSLSTLGGGSTAATLSALGLSAPATAGLSTLGTSAASALTAYGAPATSVGQRIVQAAEGEVGQAEQPPGSNDSPRIAQYRQATAGSGVGPWCAYFASWAAAQAGAPLGEVGQGFGSVSALAGWAQRTGRSEPVGAGYTPQPGDLIVWGGEHVGVIESVDPDGTLHTIEGNSSNAVTRRTHSATGDGATEFVRCT